MKILFYSSRDYEKPYLEEENTAPHEVQFISDSLSLTTAEKAKGFEAISIFTGDDAFTTVIQELFKNGVRYIAIRAAGYDNVDIAKATELGIKVANVPEYSPYAIAEHALTLMLALNRKLIIANQQVHQQNFTIGNLIGFDLNKKTVGIVGTGRIGRTLVKILHGLGCRLIGYDIDKDKSLVYKYGLEYMTIEDLCELSDIISIHTCLTPQTHYIINKDLIKIMKPGVMLINTSRGACINTADVIRYLENGHIGYFGADVYEKEKGIFFYDLSGKQVNDEMLKKLMSMPNVIITPHQAFATKDALTNIAKTTFYNIDCWAQNENSENRLFANAGPGSS